jgi:hypothetical protein
MSVKTYTHSMAVNPLQAIRCDEDGQMLKQCTIDRHFDNFALFNPVV